MLHHGRASCISKTGQWFSIPRTLRSSVASLERNMLVEGVLRRANDVRVNFSRRSGSTNEGRSPSPNPTSSSYAGELFLDQTTRHPTCVLCGEQLTSCSSQVHRTYGHHVSRLIVVQRAIHLIMVYMQLLPLAQTNRDELKKHLQHPKLRTLLDEIDFAEPPWVAGRDGMMNQLDVVAVVLRRWWRQLQSPEYPAMADAAEAPPTFNRLPSLSSSSGRERLCRLRSLLLMLKTQGVLTGLNTSSSSAMGDDVGFTRNTSFQRFEMIGDNVFKHAVPDRMRILFPDVEMHFTNVVGSMQQLIDSNSSLREMYDYLHLSHLTKANLSHSKAKADAVEALFGELQALLWSSEYNVGQVNVEVEPTRELRAIRAIVAHTLNELAHTGFMWRMEETLLQAKPVIEAFTINSKEVHWQRMWEEQAAPHAPHSSGRCMYPVLSFFPRPHPITGHLPPGEVYSYSCAAPPQASPHHNRQRILSTTSMSSTKLKNFYAAECPSKQPLWETLCNNTSLVSEMHASCIPALLPSAGSTTPREPRMSAEEAWVRVGAPSFDLF